MEYKVGNRKFGGAISREGTFLFWARVGNAELHRIFPFSSAHGLIGNDDIAIVIVVKQVPYEGTTTEERLFLYDWADLFELPLAEISAGLGLPNKDVKEAYEFCNRQAAAVMRPAG